MKFKARILFFLLASCPVVFASVDPNQPCNNPGKCNIESSHTFLTVRNPWELSLPVRISSYRADQTHMREDGLHSAFQAVLFGGKSTNPEDIARYFLPWGKTELLVGEQAPTSAQQQGQNPLDLLAQNFNIFTNNGTFRSKIAIRPKQTFIGLGFEYRHSFYRCEDKGRGFWWAIAFPIEHVRNHVGFCELIIDTGGGIDPTQDAHVVANMTDAFRQGEWKFGKIAKEGMTLTRVGDINLRLGYEWLQWDPYHLESYIGVVIPTGNKPTGEYLFEPIVGNNHHIGAIFGSSFGFQLWENQTEEYSLHLEYNVNSQYLFENTQCRSVDLKEKPWSRYIEVYQDVNQAQQAVNLGGALGANLANPGINILTLPLHVRPGFSFNMTTAAVLDCCSHQLEIGYNFYAREAECIELACPWVEGPAIKDNDGLGQTNPIRDITGNFFKETITNGIGFGNYSFNVIRARDLDLRSASTPCALIQTVYAAATHYWDCWCDHPIATNIGGSYEFSSGSNAVLKRYTIWGKIVLSF